MSLIDQQLKLINTSLNELEKLKTEIGKLENIRKDIEDTKIGVESLPKELMYGFEKVKTLSVSFVENLGKATVNYIEGNNTLFAENLKELSKSNAELKKQIIRIEKIDLKKDFAELQKTLSEIFGAVNAINLTLTNIVQTLTVVVQTLGNIQTTLYTNHKESKQFLNSFSEVTEKHLTNQDKQATKSIELIVNEIRTLSEQNEILKKEIETNRIIQIVGFIFITMVFFFVFFNK